ncbi:MAG: hypothetical protein WBQ44_11760 [Rhodococcus sp. (in: high G+C Gram-positive bacteria)]
MAPAASLRGGAVGASTVALAVAAHGAAGGGYPSGSALTFLMIVGVGAGMVARLPSPRTGYAQFATVLAGLLLGQSAGHVVLTVASPHEHGLLPSATMALFHLTASAAAALLVCAAEALYGPITRVVRAILAPPRSLPSAPASLVAADRLTSASAPLFGTSISRRGPPASAFAL